jgi:hypothetical protein
VSYDLAVFDPAAAPTSHAKFVADASADGLPVWLPAGGKLRAMK